MEHFSKAGREVKSNFVKQYTIPRPKPRTLHSEQCSTIARTETGSACLRNPISVRKSSKDPNRGLYPRKRKRQLANMEKQNDDAFLSSDYGIENWSQTDPFPNVGEPTRNDHSNDLDWELFDEQVKSSTQQQENYTQISSACKNYMQYKPSATFTPASQIALNFQAGKELGLSSEQKMDSMIKPNSSGISSQQKNHHVPPQSNTMLSYFKPSSKLESPEPSASTIHMYKDLKVSNDKAFKTNDNGKRPSTSAGIIKTDSDDDIIIMESFCNVTKESGDTLIQQQKERTQAFKDRYGLCGSGKYPKLSDKASAKGSILTIPSEILELIFAQVPMLDLCLYLTRVCHHWNDVIKNENFMRWKKLYNKVKLNMDDGLVEEECKTNNMDTSEDCLMGLIKYMAKFRPVLPGMFEALSKLSQFNVAVAVIRERAPEIALDDCKCTWSIVVQMCIMSESVANITSILNTLLHSCTVPNVLDGFYCIASFLFSFKKVLKINPGLHYRLYYALYLYENKSIVTSANLAIPSGAGQQSIFRYGTEDSRLKLTNEQARIVNHNLQPGQHIKIVALAGTGKTTTLVRFAEMRPNKRFLNIMFNKSVAEHAKKLFPRNVTSSTIHSLAWKDFGSKYRHKQTSKVNAYSLMEHITAPGDKMRSAGIILQTIINFLNSAEFEITTAHIPEVGKDRETIYNLTILEKNALVTDSVRIYQMMCDRNNKEIRSTHDLYLKLFQLSRPKLLGYDCLFVDEAQDCNAAMIDIIMNQNFPCIIVGDPHQQIYSFRGAVSALNRLECSHTYYLTQSFRFGPEIAYVASCALEFMKGVHDKTLVGGDKPSFVDGSREGQLAILARSNACLFQEAVDRCCKENVRPPRAAYAGGIQSYGLDQIVDIYKLLVSTTGDGYTKDYISIKDKFIGRFRSFAALDEYARKVKDVELLGKISIVMKHTSKIPEYVEKIKRFCSNRMEMADVVFSTVHKSKGLEFDTVYLARDCTVIDFKYNRNTECAYVNPQSDLDEANILYVAITRAKKRLILSPCAYLMLQFAQEKFEYVKLCPTTEEQTNEPVHCLRCNEVQDLTKMKVAVLARKRIELSTGEVVTAGIHCFKCASLGVQKPRWPREYYNMYKIIEEFPIRIGDHLHTSLRAFVGPHPGEAADVELSDLEDGDFLMWEFPPVHVHFFPELAVM